MDRSLRIARVVNVVLCLVGAAVFAGLLAYIQAQPKEFERRVQAAVIAKVEQHLKEKLSTEPDGRMDKLAGKLSERMSGRLETLQAEIQAGIPRFVASVVAAMCRLDCRNRAVLEAAILDAYQRELGRLRLGIQKLRGMVEARYHIQLEALRRDASIFLASNLIVMSAALLLAVVRGPAARHLLPFTVMLSTATVLASLWYLYGQDWISTVIYSDYVGWSYLGFLAGVFVFLADIALNRAQMTTHLLNAIGSLFSAVSQFSPC